MRGILIMFLFCAALPSLPGGSDAATGAAKPKKAPVDQPFWTGKPDTTAFEKMQAARLAHAQVLIDQMAAAKGPRTIANTLQPYDDALLELDAVASQSSLMENVHPDPALRKTAEQMSQKADAFSTAL